MIHLSANGQIVTIQRKQQKNKAKTQLIAFEKLLSGLDAIDDESITDENITNLQNNRVHIRRELDL